MENKLLRCSDGDFLFDRVGGTHTRNICFTKNDYQLDSTANVSDR